jgi:hypothetical protein
MMSDWSEENWCAGWLIGLEENLPRLIRNVDDGETPIAEDLLIMQEIADMLGHWAKLNEDAAFPEYVPHVPECDRDRAEG